MRGERDEYKQAAQSLARALNVLTHGALAQGLALTAVIRTSPFPLALT
jgi:hypothetical protein